MELIDFADRGRSGQRHDRGRTRRRERQPERPGLWRTKAAAAGVGDDIHSLPSDQKRGISEVVVPAVIITSSSRRSGRGRALARDAGPLVDMPTLGARPHWREGSAGRRRAGAADTLGPQPLRSLRIVTSDTGSGGTVADGSRALHSSSRICCFRLRFLS
jgi:hypothetical protein